MRSLLVKAFFISFVLFCGVGVAKATDRPSSYIKNLESDIRTFIRVGNIKAANSIFAERFDIDSFGKRCLIDHWSELSADEKDRYKKLLEQNIKKSMNKRMIFVEGDAKFRLKTRKISKEEDLIKTENSLSVRAKKINLGVYLVRKNDKYFVADYDFDGVLLSRQYRGQFNRILRRDGKDAFFTKLENKLIDL